MLRILMVEDDREFAEVLTECLSVDPEFEITEIIRSESDARTRFADGVLDTVDAVLMDLRLPKSLTNKDIDPESGLNLIAELRMQHNFTGRVIVLTNSHSLADGTKALRYGCDAFLCKHVRMSELPILVSELRMAIRRDVMLLSSEMRFVFLRDLDSSSSAQQAG